MQTASKWVAAGVLGLAAAAGAVAGCHSDAQDYRTQRPPVDQVSPYDRGLQSKDVLDASDRMTMDLLREVPYLMQSGRPLRIVTAPVHDETIDRKGHVNYDIFIQRLKSNLSQQSGGRVTLVQNRDDFNLFREKELEGGGGGGADEFGQGDGGSPAPGGPRPRNPDYVLYGTARDLPNRSTNFYQVQFELSDLRSREIVWSRTYEVKTSR
jgi:hypothetical protein